MRRGRSGDPPRNVEAIGGAKYEVTSMPSRRDARFIPPLPAEGQHSLEAIMADFARLEAEAEHRARAAGMTRRDFLHAVAAGAAVGAVAASATAGLAAEAPTTAPTGSSATPAASSSAKAPTAALPAKSRVVVITHPEVLVKEYRVNPPIIKQMVDRGIAELTGAAKAADGWAAVGHEDDAVAIKYNSIGAPTLDSHPEINFAVAAQLVALGRVDPKNIFIVDRTLPAPLNELSDPFVLPTRSLQTRLRRLYTDKATAIINVSVLKSHYGDGLSAALKNHLGSVNNPAAFHGWDSGRLPRSLPELSALAPIRTKTRLVIIDAVRPLFAGGPADDPQFRWYYKALIFSTDPVAASAVGMRILEEKRAAARGKEWPMTAAREMFAYAQSIGLGNAGVARIDLVKVAMG